METKTTAIARINNVDIVLINDGEKRIAIRPICEALGVSYQAQIDKVKNDAKFNSTVMLSITVGADGKQREMVTIPFKKVFGWLYSINANNVKPEARENLIRYQEECNDALYTYFTRHDEYLEYRQQRMSESFAKQFEARNNFAYAKVLLQEANIDFRKWMTYNEEDFLADKAQLKLDFGTGKEAEDE